MAEPFGIFAEPKLEFRYGQQLEDPRCGLALFGPYDTDRPEHPKSVNYAVIGTQEGIAGFGLWSSLIAEAQTAGLEHRGDPIWPPYPGFEAAFAAAWSREPCWSHVVEGANLHSATSAKDPYVRARKVVETYLAGFEVARKRDERVDVVICVVPDAVLKNCGPRSFGRHLAPAERRERARQEDLFDKQRPEAYELSPDFRRQLKARAMSYSIPLQIVLESTLRLGPRTKEERRELSPLPDRCWNLAVALYYKAGGKPWRLSTAREGVCYIGVAFRRAEVQADGRTACCAAQMFLDSGDGIVFLGDEGPWYSAGRRECHLSHDAAHRLLSGVLQTYRQLNGAPLKEVFLHSRSSIDDDEFDGYREACPPGVKLVGVRVRPEDDGLKLYRHGDYPVMRGTFWRVNDRRAFLWGSGFRPALRTYDGSEVPTPLRVEVQHGEADISRVGEDIFGLTKLNYNSSHPGDSEPVTIRFSDAVGEILVSNPAVTTRHPKFKYYI